MAWPPGPPKSKTLTERIADANRELKLARQDGSCEWIHKAAKQLDDLIDQLPRQKANT